MRIIDTSALSKVHTYIYQLDYYWVKDKGSYWVCFCWYYTAQQNMQQRLQTFDIRHEDVYYNYWHNSTYGWRLKKKSIDPVESTCEYSNVESVISLIVGERNAYFLCRVNLWPSLEMIVTYSAFSPWHNSPS